MIKYIISFKARTYAQLLIAYSKLKERWNTTVSMRTIPMGAGLYRGHFSIL